MSTADSPPLGAIAAPAKRSSRVRSLVLGGIGVATLAGVAIYVTKTRGLESTDDAQIDAEVVAVPARTGGTVAQVHFRENQQVKQGDLLAVLDDEAPRARLAQAEANLQAAEANAAAAEAEARVAETSATGSKAVAEATLQTASVGALTADDQIKEAEASLRSAEANLQQVTAERARNKALFDQGAISKATFDQSETSFDVASSARDVARARVASLKSAASQARTRIVEANARVRQTSAVEAVTAQAQARAKAARAQADTAKALRDLAKLELSYTRISAPHGGVVSKKGISVGQAVAPGQAVVQLVTPDVWVTANFKETQLERMRAGQPVTIAVDAFPGVKLHGTVESFSGATGARFTLLPPDNASGNFTKVVQRVPVRIRIDGPPPGVTLLPGLSVDVTVNTRG